MRNEQAYWKNKAEELRRNIAAHEAQDETTKFFKKDYIELLKSELKEAEKHLS